MKRAERITTFNKDNFYKATKANWKKIKKVSFEERITFTEQADYRSVSSFYKYAKERVYRLSNHFLTTVASCRWLLDGEEYKDSHEYILAFCAWEDFEMNLTTYEPVLGMVVEGYWKDFEFHVVA